MNDPNWGLEEAMRDPPFSALIHRRSRRIGKGLRSVPASSLSYTSPQSPQPLSPLEEAMWIDATGITGMPIPDLPLETPDGQPLVGSPMIELASGRPAARTAPRRPIFSGSTTRELSSCAGRSNSVPLGGMLVPIRRPSTHPQCHPFGLAKFLPSFLPPEGSAKEKEPQVLILQLLASIGVTGLEPATSWSRITAALTLLCERHIEKISRDNSCVNPSRWPPCVFSAGLG
jgi:hypothetical protein